MYLRHTIRKKDGKVHCTWRLVRSVRVGRRVIQQTVAYLGEPLLDGNVSGRAARSDSAGPHTSRESARLYVATHGHNVGRPADRLGISRGHGTDETLRFTRPPSDLIEINAPVMVCGDVAPSVSFRKTDDGYCRSRRLPHQR
jgi:hypothetical protein